MTLNRSELDRLLTGDRGPVKSKVAEIARRTVNEAKRLAPVDSGEGRASIHWEWRSRNGLVRAWAGTTLDYMYYQHEGTEAHGPKTASVMVFRPKQGHPQRAGRKGGRGGKVFATWVEGVKPHPFMVNGLRASTSWPIKKL
ncbi:hypothetical protein FHX42_005307 [Saccharopolyspora lacisalsi]|uniref:HK97 gp10 family phage protein n=1 Tax=Halosaccharopolyspora lacisalsi TaxID=1000566 RepID=A0A839E4D6_9PSEU|nr:hypothetical protein [Halosaccharopolyspora lacisalsi]